MTLLPERYTDWAVYWGSPTPNGTGGYTFAAGRNIRCKWINSTELFTNQQGKEQRARAQVFVTENLVLEGYLYFGQLSSLSAAEQADPQLLSSAYQIAKFDSYAGIDGTKTCKMAWV